jgi:hypothetical protein
MALTEGGVPRPEDVFNMHEFLPGRFVLGRKSDSTLVLNGRLKLPKLPTSGGPRLLPGVVPMVNEIAGYLETDLISRIPYLPANYADGELMTARTRAGGADIWLGDGLVGELAYWNLKWAPTHDRALGTTCGIATTVTEGACQALFGNSGMMPSIAWRAKTLVRADDYGAWTESVHWGMLNAGDA